jgi:hypothetical protein
MKQAEIVEDFKKKLSEIISDSQFFENLWGKVEILYSYYQKLIAIDEALLKGRLFVKVFFESLYFPLTPKDYLKEEELLKFKYFIKAPAETLSVRSDWRLSRFKIIKESADDLGISQKGFGSDYYKISSLLKDLNTFNYEQILEATEELKGIKEKYRDFFEEYKRKLKSGIEQVDSSTD